MRAYRIIIFIIFIFTHSSNVIAAESDIFLNKCNQITDQKLQGFKNYINITADEFNKNIEEILIDYELVSQEDDDFNYIIRVNRSGYGIINYIFNRDSKNDEFYLKQFTIESSQGNGKSFEFYDGAKNVQKYYEYSGAEIEGPFVELYQNGKFKLILYAKSKTITGCNIKFDQYEKIIQIVDR